MFLRPYQKPGLAGYPATLHMNGENATADITVVARSWSRQG